MVGHGTDFLVEELIFPEDWGFLDTLAATLAAAGRFESAVRVAKAALERAPENERPQMEYVIGRYLKGLTWSDRKP